MEALAGFLPYNQEPTRIIVKELRDLQDTEIAKITRATEIKREVKIRRSKIKALLSRPETRTTDREECQRFHAMRHRLPRTSGIRRERESEIIMRGTVVG